MLAARNARKPKPPLATPTTTLMAEQVHGAKEPLQVRIPISVKRQFKAYAALRGMEPNELFLEVWDHYEQTHKEY